MAVAGGLGPEVLAAPEPVTPTPRQRTGSRARAVIQLTTAEVAAAQTAVVQLGEARTAAVASHAVMPAAWVAAAVALHQHPASDCRASDPASELGV